MPELLLMLSTCFRRTSSSRNQVPSAFPGLFHSIKGAWKSLPCPLSPCGTTGIVCEAAESFLSRESCSHQSYTNPPAEVWWSQGQQLSGWDWIWGQRFPEGWVVENHWTEEGKMKKGLSEENPWAEHGVRKAILR